MQSPDVNVAVGHQHIQLSLCQVSSGEWKSIVRQMLHTVEGVRRMLKVACAKSITNEATLL